MNNQTKFNRTIIIMISGILLLAIQLYAQDHRGQRRPDGPPPLPDSAQVVQMVDQLAGDLSLSAEQKAEVLQLHHEHFAKAREMKDKQRGSMENSRKDFEDQVEALLTDEQKTQFRDINKQHGQQNRPAHREQKRR